MTQTKIFGIVGWKNSGKTGLMCRLVTEFTARGLVVSTLKHTHHGVDLEVEGTDTHRHRVAGAKEVVLASSARVTKLHELRDEQEPTLEELVARMAPCDLVLAEGFKPAPHPKIEASRKETRSELIATSNTTVRAIASDFPIENSPIPRFDLDDTMAIADFILAEVGLAATTTQSSGLKNDCFALPAGVHWTPVDEALETLKSRISPVVRTETISTNAANGRIISRDHLAARSNPPAANSAVDGYGFAHASCPSVTPISLPLVDGRAAAGEPYLDTVPPGYAIRILTGALLPDGVDTVVLEEDVSVDDGVVQVPAAPKPLANRRRAGEDIEAGKTAVRAHHKLRTPDIALLHALGLPQVDVFKKLRVGVLSTGDELAPSGSTMDPARTYDANRPMLLSMIEDWGHASVDLGHISDDRTALRNAFDAGAESADVMITSGGASAGDEDHVSALLQETGALHHWRIAIKPGRPLALAQWGATPVFGLPGNPVAALVCALIFARPALSVLAGGGWLEPQGFSLPAGFSKRKKPGRREYLRARIGEDGRVETFKSEGSGRISGLSWATGLVELPDHGMDVSEGDLVRYIPYTSFGLT